MKRLLVVLTVLAACQLEPSSNCDETPGDCVPETTSSSSTTDAPSDTDPDFIPIVRIECVPLPSDGGECPAPESECLRDTLETRDDISACGCDQGFGVSEVLSGPDPDTSNACCYEVLLRYTECVE